MLQNLVLLSVSSFCVAFAQVPSLPIFAYLSSSLAFAIFWKVYLAVSGARARFLLALVWFLPSQLVQLSWMTAYDYQGYYVFIIYALFTLAWSLQFAFVSTFCKPTVFSAFRLAAFWTGMELLRLHVLCGYIFSPVGLAFMNNSYSSQLAAYFGLYSLSFILILTNMLFLRFLVLRKGLFLYLLVLIFPYALGLYRLPIKESSGDFKALLVQTSLYPPEKSGFGASSSSFVAPIEQWRRILSYLSPYKTQDVDLILMPENTLPFPVGSKIFLKSEVDKLFLSFFGDESAAYLAQAEHFTHFYYSQELVGHDYFSQSLANIFSADVVIGLEYFEEKEGREEVYAGALVYRGGLEKPLGSYAKRVLIPIAEKIPFDFLKPLAAYYGISDSFTEGKEEKVFLGNKVPYAISICYEEGLGNGMRQKRLGGAELLLNLSNAAWYPRSKLAEQLFYLARARAIEAGVPVLRAANTGITGAIDPFGRTLAVLKSDKGDYESPARAFLVSLSLDSFSTLYSQVGDAPLYAIFFLFVFLVFC